MSIEYLKNFMDEEDKEMIGIDIKDINELELIQKIVLLNYIDSNCSKEEINENKYLYVVSPDGRFYIVPAMYKEALRECNFDCAYYTDVKPSFCKIKIDKDGLSGTIYFINNEDEKNIFVTKNATSIIKDMSFVEIVNYISNASENQRKR